MSPRILAIRGLKVYPENVCSQFSSLLSNMTLDRQEESIGGSIYQAEYPNGVILCGLVAGKDHWWGVHSAKERFIHTEHRRGRKYNINGIRLR